MNLKDILISIKAVISAKLAVNGLKILALKLSTVTLVFSTNIILARELGPNQFGIYVYLLSIISVGSIFIRLGTETSAVRYVAEYKGINASSRLLGFIRFWSFVLFVNGLLIVGVGFLLNHYFGFLKEYNLNSWYFYLVFIGIFPFNIAVLKGYNMVVRATLLEGFSRHFIFLFFVVSFILWWRIDLTYSILFIIGSLVLLIIILLSLFSIKKSIWTKIEKRNPKYEWREWVNTTIPFMFISSVHILATRVDIFMIKHYIDEESAGIYDISTKIAEFAFFGILSIDALLAPVFSSLFFKKEIKKLHKIISISTLMNFLTTLVASILIYIFLDCILALFGEGYETAKSPLLILLLFKLIIASLGSVAIILSMTGHQKVVSGIILIGAISNVILNYLFIGYLGLGMKGAAYATGISTIIWYTLGSFFVYRFIGGKTIIIFVLWTYFLDLFKSNRRRME